jgi:hypothetical protein
VQLTEATALVSTKISNKFERIVKVDESDENMLSGSLKERLAQYKTLKEEEQKIAASPASPDLPVPSEAATPGKKNQNLTETSSRIGLFIWTHE